MVTVEIYLHPLAWKVLRRECHDDGTAVDITTSWYYDFFRMLLERPRTVTEYDQSVTPKNFVKGKVYIYPKDLERMGCHVRRLNQVKFSKAVTEREKERLCDIISTAHVFGGFSKRSVTFSILDSLDYDFEELNHEALKKYFQRTYSKRENIEKANLQTLKELKHTQKDT